MTDKKEYRIEGRDSTIFKVMNREQNPYVVMDRRPLENKDLSYKAKGILAYLLSRPDGWEVNVPDLVNRGDDGVRAIRSGLKELSAQGHIRYNVTRDGNRIKKWVIEVYEVPHLNPDYGKPVPEAELAEALDADFELVQNVQVQNEFVQKDTQVLSTLSNKEVSKRYTVIATALQGLTGGLNSTSADMIGTWIEKHSDEWIFKAIETAKDKGARSAKYVDSVLIGWEANGYPKPRSQRVADRKTKQEFPDNPNVPSLDERMRIAASLAEAK